MCHKLLTCLLTVMVQAQLWQSETVSVSVLYTRTSILQTCQTIYWQIQHESWSVQTRSDSSLDSGWPWRTRADLSAGIQLYSVDRRRLKSTDGLVQCSWSHVKHNHVTLTFLHVRQRISFTRTHNTRPVVTAAKLPVQCQTSQQHT